ncbi:putative receptor-type tyrosine-protein phosphatase kappa [Apostichopus japonicus]|uniref:Putative receptor-type tyrosine-protein phosphatase kappa n=1 Tax=Stichopus japonicus TaxID=307972 RepID=A0A2G8KZD5_STIJA|nr:putative receptor-type tyrosine-protein phosphatase kappa [Apostichopus japonicus]
MSTCVLSFLFSLLNVRRTVEDGSVEILLILIMKARALPLRKVILLLKPQLERRKVDQKIPDTDHETRTDQAIPVYDNVQQPAPLPLTELARYITKCQSGAVDTFNEQFMGLSGDKTFIACQGPNKASLNDFWRMIWQEHVLNIVMLTNLVERGKEEEVRTVRIFHFLTWPDMDIPEQPTPLISLTKQVKAAQENVSAPLVVHCR